MKRKVIRCYNKDLFCVMIARRRAEVTTLFSKRQVSERAPRHIQIGKRVNKMLFEEHFFDKTGAQVCHVLVTE